MLPQSSSAALSIVINGKMEISQFVAVCCNVLCDDGGALSSELEWRLGWRNKGGLEKGRQECGQG